MMRNIVALCIANFMYEPCERKVSYDVHHGEKALMSYANMKIQISVRIGAVWSGQFLFVNIYYTIHWFYKHTMKA